MKFALAILICAAIATPGLAQTRSLRDTTTAYGARLTGRAASTGLNPNRVNSRIDTRINTRLSLRIERYTPDSTINPTAAFQVTPTDKSRLAPITIVQQQPADE